MKTEEDMYVCMYVSNSDFIGDSSHSSSETVKIASCASSFHALRRLATD